MAKMKMGMDIAAIMQQALKSVENDVQLAIHKEVSHKVGVHTATTIHAQMRAKGIRPAKLTGTHDKRSTSQKAKANKYGSMLDTYYKAWRSKDMNRDIVFAGQTLAAYKARFRNDGWKNHHYWEKSGQGSGSGNDVGGEHYIEAAQKILAQDVPKLVQSTMQRVLANPKQFKAKYKIST
jgi:hypothetical protein